jgi:hypothetical protein
MQAHNLGAARDQVKRPSPPREKLGSIFCLRSTGRRFCSPNRPSRQCVHSLPRRTRRQIRDAWVASGYAELRYPRHVTVLVLQGRSGEGTRREPMTTHSDAKGARARSHSASKTEKAGRYSRIRKAFFDFPATSRRAISRHRQIRRQRDREISDQSRRGLDWTNFFVADVQVGFGAFLAYYLANLGWSKQSVGLALTVGALAGVLAQIPGGALADAVRWKRGLLACGIAMIATSALILALWPSMPLVFAAVVLHGIS